MCQKLNVFRHDETTPYLSVPTDQPFITISISFVPIMAAITKTISDYQIQANIITHFNLRKRK